MDEMLEQFLIEGRDLVAAAHAALKLLERDPANAAQIDSAFRAVHTLKGSVAIFDMAAAERVLHAAEDQLSSARSAGTALGARVVLRLVATLDQVDRWIDDIEHTGALGSDADGVAARLLDDGQFGLPSEPAIEDVTPGWLVALVARRKHVLAQSDVPLTAFRYTPDNDAFFRGEDPIGLIATVPELKAVDVWPAGGAWPARDELEPFACIMVIEGLAAASPETLSPIFRLVPGQVNVVPVDRIEQASTGPTTDRDGVPAVTTIIRVEAGRVDKLIDDVGELLIATNGFAALADRADEVDRRLALDIRVAHAGLERAVGAVSRSVSLVRMVSLAPSLRRLPRLVREIAASLDKTVSFEMVGEHLEVDKQIGEGLYEPLLHLVRNALDHGIEPGAVRSLAGKPVTGSLSLKIAREDDNIVVALKDDGAGIDRVKVRDIAIAHNLIARDVADGLSDAGTLALLFTPGFSTAATVTGVSGRGVGMDAVRDAVDRLRGRIDIASVVGLGTTIELRLPAGAITTRLLVIDVGCDRYAVPFDQIVETVQVSANGLIPLGSGIACILRERTMPVLSLAELLGGVDSGALPAKLLVTRMGGEPIAVRVDGFHERLDTMVRPPSGLLNTMPLVGGTTVMGDGSVMLVLNLANLVA